MSNKPITDDMLEVYIKILEKQVQQATLVVTTLEELNEKLDQVEKHFTNGFRSEIMDHTTKQVALIVEKLEKTLTTSLIIKESADRTEEGSKELSHQERESTTEIKDKISGLKGDLAELKSAMKVERAVSIAGWSTFIITMITMVLKLFGRL